MGEREDQAPGFWCRYEPPTTAVAALVQMPSYRIDGYSLAVAYMRDWRARSRIARPTEEPQR